MADETNSRTIWNDEKSIYRHYLEGRKLKVLQAAIKREYAQIAKAIAELEAVDYYCAEAAKAALDKFIDENLLEYHSFSGKTTLEERIKKRFRRSRLRKDEIKEDETWHKIKSESLKNRSILINTKKRLVYLYC